MALQDTEMTLFSGKSRQLRARIVSARPRLYRMAYSWTHDTARADDLAQEAVLRAMERLAQLRDPERLDVWLFRILVNCWHDTLRMPRGVPGSGDVLEQMHEPGPGPESACLSAQTVASVRRAVSELPLPQREVLTLIDLEELSYAQAAEILQVPMGTVMSRLHRARALLLRQLAGMHGAEKPAGSRLRRVK